MAFCLVYFYQINDIVTLRTRTDYPPLEYLALLDKLNETLINELTSSRGMQRERTQRNLSKVLATP